MALLTRLLDRFGSTDSTDAEDVHRRVAHLAGTTPISQLSPRGEATVGGVVVALTRSVPQDSPRLDISISDGTGVVHARFLGLRQIPGISAGRTLTLTGRFSHGQTGGLQALNPRYQLFDTHDD